MLSKENMGENVVVCYFFFVSCVQDDRQINNGEF